MVAIAGYSVVGHAINVLRTGYNRLGSIFSGGGTSLPISVSSKPRKHGREIKKRYNSFTKDNSVVLMPGALPKGCSKDRRARKVEGNHKSMDCDSNQKAREPEKLHRMQDLEQSERKERAKRRKDKKIAQLEKERNNTQAELTRERIQRQQSRLERSFKARQRRHQDAEIWRRRMEKEAMLAAAREEELRQENSTLRDNLQVTDTAFQQACQEREYWRGEMEEEKVQRLRTEETLRQWEELMSKYFPAGDPPPYTSEQLQEPPSVEAQFELYEQKWTVLRAGVDIDGSKIHIVNFYQIPWPVINMTVTHPNQIQPQHVREFLAHPLRSEIYPTLNERQRVRYELMRWHPDKFQNTVVSKVREEDKASAIEASGIICRILTKMLS